MSTTWLKVINQRAVGRRDFQKTWQSLRIVAYLPATTISQIEDLGINIIIMMNIEVPSTKRVPRAIEGHQMYCVLIRNGRTIP
jgi:hypothetical protein